MGRPYKILVTGSRGQLGSDLVGLLSTKYDIHGIDIDSMDITDKKAVDGYICKLNPQIILHTAAYTNVDNCELNVEKTMQVNSEATQNIAQVCRKIKAWMIYYSTDYVFDGTIELPYTEEIEPNPLNVYGRSKLEGENNVRATVKKYTILRISWVYGKNGNNFIKTMIRLGEEQLNKKAKGKKIVPLRIVSDQIGNPTWTVDVVRQTEKIIENDLTGLYHATSKGLCSWYDLAGDIFSILKMPVEIEPCMSDDYKSPAVRPKFSALKNSRLDSEGINMMPDYKESLRTFLHKYTGEE